jgi:hypothetical protein
MNLIRTRSRADSNRPKRSKSRKMKNLTHIMLLCLFGNTALAQVKEVQNVTAKEYQKKFDELTKEGYRPIKVWSKTLGVFDYVGGEKPSFGYWATFKKTSNGTPWVARHGLDAATYQQEFNKWTAQGYVPTDINVACVNNVVRYCVIFDRVANPPAWQARHNVSRAEFEKTNNDLIAKGFTRKITSSACGVYAGLWQKR